MSGDSWPSLTIKVIKSVLVIQFELKMNDVENLSHEEYFSLLGHSCDDTLSNIIIRAVIHTVFYVLLEL